VRAGWQVISELALRLGLDLDVLSGAMASRRLLETVPFYEGLTLEEIDGRGLRWQEREGAARFPTAEPVGEEPPALAPREEGPEAAARARELAGFHSVWDAPEVEFSPALEFLFPRRELVGG
jgi:NADH-quinone oxidoreductase subunit G